MYCRLGPKCLHVDLFELHCEPTDDVCSNVSGRRPADCTANGAVWHQWHYQYQPDRHCCGHYASKLSSQASLCI